MLDDHFLNTTHAIVQVLAALDVHTAHFIVDKCFKGDLILGRTVLLVVSIAMVPTSEMPVL